MLNPLSIADYTVTDPPYYDPRYPPEHVPTHFMSSGSAVQAFIWLAGGQAARGCVIIPPHAFGRDGLESLIVPMVASGFHVLQYHPRGMWDDQHVFSFANAIDDVHAAVAFLRENGGRHVTQGGREYGVNPERIAVMGKSGGGGCVGWGAAAENPHLNTAIAVAPANVEHHRGPLTVEAMKEYQGDFDATAGRIDMAQWLSNMTPEIWDRLSLIKQAPRLVSKNLLLIGASADRHAKLEKCHVPIAQAQRDAGAKHFTDIVLEGDTFFLTARIALARLVISWLKTECDF